MRSTSTAAAVAQQRAVLAVPHPAAIQQVAALVATALAVVMATNPALRNLTLKSAAPKAIAPNRWLLAVAPRADVAVPAQQSLAIAMAVTSAVAVSFLEPQYHALVVSGR